MSPSWSATADVDARSRVDLVDRGRDRRDERVAVGVVVQHVGTVAAGGRRRLDQQVRPQRVVRIGRQVETRRPARPQPSEQVALRVRRHRVQRRAERVDAASGVDPVGAGRREVVVAEPAAAQREQPVAELAQVERVAAAVGDRPQRAADARAAHAVAGPAGLADQLGQLLRGPARRAGCSDADQQRRRREAVLGEADRRREHRRPAAGDRIARAARIQPSTHPGTVTRADVVAERHLGVALARAAAARRRRLPARPLAFSACTSSPSWTSANRSPPMPHRCGPVTAMAAFVAIAASTALPPRARIASPACVASWSAEATIAIGCSGRRSECDAWLTCAGNLRCAGEQGQRRSVRHGVVGASPQRRSARPVQQLDRARRVGRRRCTLVGHVRAVAAHRVAASRSSYDLLGLHVAGWTSRRTAAWSSTLVRWWPRRAAADHRRGRRRVVAIGRAHRADRGQPLSVRCTQVGVGVAPRRRRRAGPRIDGRPGTVDRAARRQPGVCWWRPSWLGASRVPGPRCSSTSRSTAGRSVMMPSTPRSSSRSISGASSIVHTCTCSPSACDALDEATVDDGQRPLLHRHLGGQRRRSTRAGRTAVQRQPAGPERACTARRRARPAQPAQPTVAERARRTPGRAQLVRRSVGDQRGRPRRRTCSRC